MGKEQFVGSWKLISSEYRSDDGEVIYPMGQQVQGRLNYDDKGYMIVQHMSANRPRFASEDYMRATPTEVQAAFHSSRAYYGTYDVDDKKGTVTHHVKGASIPNWKGQDNVRFFQLAGKRLTLTTPPQLIDGIYRVARLVWERLD